MTLKIGWLHEAEQSLGTWLHEADDWHRGFAGSAGISGSIWRQRSSGTFANFASTNPCRSHSIRLFKRF